MAPTRKYDVTDLSERSCRLTIPQLIELQSQWQRQVSQIPLPHPPKTIAGADLTFSPDGATCWAVVVVLSLPSLEIIEKAQTQTNVTFPYVPGLLSFREAPAVVAAFRQLSHQPDVLMVDGQGLAHPRRMGLACHLGLMLDIPTIGCAKSRLIGQYRTPGPRKGASSRLMHQGEIIGRVVRTRDKVKPLFISVGHKITLAQALHLVQRCCRGYRQPEPTRQAHRLVTQLRLTFSGHSKL
ncbi:MAG: deoxyribonuclease V [Sedimentisphaerales bacterium]|nr:deoxyribonuclease V [Sedimentisphaerales bacterium]